VQRADSKVDSKVGTMALRRVEYSAASKAAWRGKKTAVKLAAC
jgi:hypothetical protein